VERGKGGGKNKKKEVQSRRGEKPFRGGFGVCSTYGHAGRWNEVGGKVSSYQESAILDRITQATRGKKEGFQKPRDEKSPSCSVKETKE